MEAVEAYDLGLMYFIGSKHRPGLDEVALRLTTLGNTQTLVLVTGLAVAAFLLASQARAALVMLFTGLGSWAVEWSLKLLVARPRPQMTWRMIDLPGGPSFPSGHALCSTAIYGSLGLILAAYVRRRWAATVIAGSGLVLGACIGMTRPYLGVHYPSDVVAGVLLGLAGALIARQAAHPSRALDEIAR